MIRDCLSVQPGSCSALGNCLLKSAHFSIFSRSLADTFCIAMHIIMCLVCSWRDDAWLKLMMWWIKASIYPHRKSSEPAKAKQLSFPGIQHEEGDLKDLKARKTNHIHLAERMQTVNAIQWRSQSHSRETSVVRQIWGTNAFADVAHNSCQPNKPPHKKARTAVTGKLADRDWQNV